MEQKDKSSRFPKERIDWVVTLVPFILILVLCGCFILFPEASNGMLTSIRYVLGDTCGIYYLVFGLGMFLVSIYLAFSKFGRITLGNPGEKPEYSTFAWATMMYTAGLAADILFYSCCEWIMYATDPQIEALGDMQLWSSTYPLFHWGPIPWSFYLVLAVAFAFMMFVRNSKKQKYSEACRPLLGDKVDKAPGRLIDLLAIFALLAGTATTFAVATPLLTEIISYLTPIPDSKWLTIVILIITCLTYLHSVTHGMSGIRKLSAYCIYLFIALLVYVLVAGGEMRYILETGFTAIGNLVTNFFKLSTDTDPLRTTGFPQAWTIFYWAYWIVWCVASPYFIAQISRGRTVRQTIIGGYGFSLLGTFTSFIILGNYGLGLQMQGKLDVIGIFTSAPELTATYETVLEVLKTLPLAPMVMVVLVVTMIAFYATSFDSISLVAACYSYKNITSDEMPHKLVTVFWAILLILLPMALVFSESSMDNLQSVSIIAAFPLAAVIVLIVASFFKDANKYIEEKHGNVT